MLRKIGRWTKVCSRHFVPEDFRLLPLKGKQRRLKPDAVPSLFTLNNFQLGKERKQLAVSHPLSLANINTNQSKNGDAKPTTEPATAETEPATAAAEQQGRNKVWHLVKFCVCIMDFNSRRPVVVCRHGCVASSQPSPAKLDWVRRID
ncbi:hypothetical protein C0Q70_00359 [Pomacea canaliculata]|uniref:THAP-type domain-containing protein n=1 Tax=Pomacea canaliculata TaxID=400727 RepID=A0A2T7PWJ3_POMCA|nr:hypothetical protein C0Q70_00359 [Pomacea canaliculata]